MSAILKAARKMGRGSGRLRSDPETRLGYAAKIARSIFDSLRSESEVLRGAAAVAPEFVRERERVRYERQAGLIKLLEEKGALRPELNAASRPPFRGGVARA